MVLEEQDRMQGELDRPKDKCKGCRTSRKVVGGIGQPLGQRR